MFAMAGLTAFLPAAAVAQEPTEHGTKVTDGLEITLLSRPPLSPAEMQQMIPGMGGMGGMQGMGGMMRGQGMEGMMRGMPGMGGMGGGEAQPTHWIGVVVRDLNDRRVVPDLQVTLTAQKGGLTRSVRLMPMPGSYGAHINLPEKGQYAVVAIARPGQPLQVAFEFDYYK
jgi:hypothetical protein